VNRRSAVARSGVCALALATVAGMSSRGLAADQIDAALSSAGKVWYEKYCMPCHGPGGAPGEAVYRASKEPVDLRTYVARHGGKFPAGDWLAVIADARPGGVHAKVWRTIRSAQPGVAGRDAAARGVVAEIARYVMSVQTK
jgi:mono/diheme cytochrome c family protein